jgi:FkbM family methyltransferase
MLARSLRRMARMVFAHRAGLKKLIPVRRPVLVRLPDFSIYVRLDDWAIGARIAVRRRYEPHVTAAMRPLLRPGGVFVDVGANVGYHTLTAAARVGPTGQVIAFEPRRDNCDLLAMSLKVNSFDNVIVHRLAVADAEGLMGFAMGGDSNGGILPGTPADSPHQVQAVTLDAFLADAPRIDVVKIDIEGMEGRAHRGMRALLRRHRSAVFTEFTPCALGWRSGISGEGYLDELRSLDYLLFVIDRTAGPSLPRNNAEIMSQLARTDLGYLDLLARARETI